MIEAINGVRRLRTPLQPYGSGHNPICDPTLPSAHSAQYTSDYQVARVCSESVDDAVAVLALCF